MSDFSLDALDASLAYLLGETRRAGHATIAEALETVRRLVALEKAAGGMDAGADPGPGPNDPPEAQSVHGVGATRTKRYFTDTDGW